MDTSPLELEEFTMVARVSGTHRSSSGRWSGLCGLGVTRPHCPDEPVEDGIGEGVITEIGIIQVDADPADEW